MIRSERFLIHAFLIGVIFALSQTWAVKAESRFYGIQVMDEATHRGVPLVELRTVHHVSLWTDSNGHVAIDEPEWFGREVFFHLRSDGYEWDKDGFGYMGVRLRPERGKIDQIHVRRTQPAERLYRITGADRYRDTRLLELESPLLLHVPGGGVVGQDSTQAVPYRDRIHWFWGDTSIFRYPLGNFRTAGAVSPRPSLGLLPPDQGIALRYFVDDDGKAAQMCPMPPKGDLIWIDGLLTLTDDQGVERMVAHYSKRKSLAEQMEHGLVVFDDTSQRFQLLKKLEADNSWRHPCGHPIRSRFNEGDYLLFGDVFYHIRVPARWEALLDPSQYESLGPVEGNSNAYQWRKDLPPVASRDERLKIESGEMDQAAAWTLPLDVESGKSIHLRRGSVRWNEHRKRYLMIANQIGGSSMLGEVWYGESDRPEGPWRHMVKIATHANYSYYNPVHREFFDEKGGRLIYFEGTYVTTF